MAKAAAKKTEPEVIETHEAIVIDPIPEPEETKEEGKKDPSKRVEESMNKTLSKYNVTNAFLAELSTKYKDLTITGQGDKDGYAAVHEARMLFVKTRTKIKDICEAGRENAVFIQKKWIAKQKELTEVILPGETRLKTLEDEYDAEKDRLKAEKIEMQRNRLRGRMQELLAMGAVSDGVDVYLDDIKFSQTDIREADDEDYQSDIVPAFKKLFDAKETIRLEKESVEKELKDEQDRQKLEFKRQQDAFKKQQEEFENQKKAAALEKRNSRISQLENIGMSPDYRNGNFVYKECMVSNDSIDTGGDEEWRMVLNGATSAIKVIKDNEEEKNRLAEEKRLEDARKKAAAELLVKEREMQLRGLGFGKSVATFDLYRGLPFIDFPSHILTAQSDFEFNTDEVWAEKISKFSEWATKKDLAIAQELKDKILKDEEDRKEQKRLKELEESENASDKEKWDTYVAQLSAVKIPTMKRQPYKDYVAAAEAFIKKILSIKK